MAAVVAFVSQKGGVGKSTLARALAREAAAGGLFIVLCISIGIVWAAYACAPKHAVLSAMPSRARRRVDRFIPYTSCTAENETYYTIDSRMIAQF